jgi:hypothetical protein
MTQFAFATGEPIDDLTDRFGLCQLAKHHGHELTPAAETLGMALRIKTAHCTLKSMSVHQRKQLAEEARMGYHPCSLR